MARPSSRERILDTLEELLIKHGSGGATLDAIAEQAGISKGGLLYHFPSKADLLTGFSNRLLDRVDRSIADAPRDPVAVIRWFLSVELSDPSEAVVSRSLTAALHGSDEGLDTVIKEVARRYSRPLEVLDPFLAEHVRLIGDGIYLNALVGAPAVSNDHLERLIAELSERASAF
ncbi:MAG TPA: TetR/AcrR family transcriptional regulator [Microthrixaceae bacterium]|nr:TetR/AcrR family transcriptional regulator [Microthrixaceae bacterium]